MSEIHTLQKETVSLLEELYRTDRLAVTPAMLSIQTGYYPALKDILATLRHYQEIERVKVFLQRNPDLVEQAKVEVEEKLAQEKEAKGSESRSSAFDDVFGDIFAIPEKPPSLFEQFKSVSINEIEQAISSAISDTLGCEARINIGAFSENTDSFHGGIKLELTIEKNISKMGNLHGKI